MNIFFANKVRLCYDFGEIIMNTTSLKRRPSKESTPRFIVVRAIVPTSTQIRDNLIASIKTLQRLQDFPSIPKNQTKNLNQSS